MNTAQTALFVVLAVLAAPGFFFCCFLAITEWEEWKEARDRRKRKEEE